ncbi:hypothetical protein OAQ04_05880, partial [Flavobacteriaceae bacterium]|nr:hypothetical protein [Flavobacteriaceae bacterium]
MPLFQKSVLKSQLEKLDDDLIQQSWEAYKSYFLNSIIQDSIINVKEEEFQSDLISNDNMKWKEIEFYNTQNQILSEGEGKFV